jgi:hypothetical protein
MADWGKWLEKPLRVSATGQWTKKPDEFTLIPGIQLEGKKVTNGSLWRGRINQEADSAFRGGRSGSFVLSQANVDFCRQP